MPSPYDKKKKPMTKNKSKAVKVKNVSFNLQDLLKKRDIKRNVKKSTGVSGARM